VPPAVIDFAQLFARSPNPYMLLGRDLRYAAANEAYLKAVSVRLEDLLGRHVFDAFPNDPADPDNEGVSRIRASFARVLATGEPDVIALIPYRVPCEQGGAPEQRFWSVTHTPIRDERGGVSFILQHAVDVTELHNLKLAADSQGAQTDQREAGVLGRAQRVQDQNVLLQAERQHLRNLFQQAPGFVAIVRGPTHIFELANTAYYRLIGHREILGKPAREALPEVEGQGFFDLLDRVYSTGQPFVGRGMRTLLARAPDAPLEEAWLDFVYQPIVDDAGVVTGIFAQGNDVTGQQRLTHERAALLAGEQAARAAAEAAEREHRFLAESIPQQVWTAGPEGALDYVSRRVLDYFAASSEEVLGAGWLGRLHPDDVPGCVQRWTASVRTGDPYEIEFRLRRHDGQYRWHLGRAEAFRGPDGAILRWFGTNTDIDEATRSRDVLRERAEYEQQLIGIVSHDLRNPIHAIGLSAALLLRRGNLDPQQGSAVARISSSALRAGRMIRDFLDFTQARSVGRIPVEPEPANLRELVEQVVDEVHLAHPDHAATVRHEGEETGRWDADRISQVVGNLVGNAFQHSQPEARVTVTSRGAADAVEVEIHNEGPPIPPELMARLFEPFQRGAGARNPNGGSLGLGLFISQRLAAAHGGRIEVSSTAEEGTRFVVRLPRFAKMDD